MNEWMNQEWPLPIDFEQGKNIMSSIATSTALHWMANWEGIWGNLSRIGRCSYSWWNGCYIFFKNGPEELLRLLAVPKGLLMPAFLLVMEKHPAGWKQHRSCELIADCVRVRSAKRFPRTISWTSSALKTKSTSSEAVVSNYAVCITPQMQIL